MRLALLSNVTVDLLAGMLKKTNEIYIPIGFDTWQQDIIAPSSGLYNYNPEAVFVVLHAGSYERENRGQWCQTIDEWCTAFSLAAEKLPGVPIFISSIDICEKVTFGSESINAQYVENYLIEKVQKIHDEGSSVYILPVKEAISNIGRDNFYSSKMWYLGSMPYSAKGLAALEELITRYASVTKGMHKKCLAVDLDNTLWGGVIGEDGADGIVLSNHKEGARYYDTQKLLKKMKNQGVMLAILSKNNAEDVEAVYSHPYMVLNHDDFVAEVINWEPKTVNIRQLASDLNIGLDSFVFLDDNPAERERMKAECPEVTVIDFPNDSSLLPKTVEEAYNKYFLALDVTGEDLKKTAMYRAETQRKAEMKSAASVEDYLKNLEMTMSIHKMLPEEEKRVVQLVNKTNQFNLTTKRYSEEEIKALAERGDIITVHMRDKYGDQGLVSVLILKYEKALADIDSFLMSCRVMGRSAEKEIIALVKEMLIKKSISRVSASYIKTAKNAPVAELYDNLGFSVVSGSESEKYYEADINNLPKRLDIFKEVIINL